MRILIKREHYFITSIMALFHPSRFRRTKRGNLTAVRSSGSKSWGERRAGRRGACIRPRSVSPSACGKEMESESIQIHIHEWTEWERDGRSCGAGAREGRNFNSTPNENRSGIIPSSRRDSPVSFVCVRFSECRVDCRRVHSFHSVWDGAPATCWSIVINCLRWCSYCGVFVA